MYMYAMNVHVHVCMGLKNVLHIHVHVHVYTCILPTIASRDFMSPLTLATCVETCICVLLEDTNHHMRCCNTR